MKETRTTSEILNRVFVLEEMKNDKFYQTVKDLIIGELRALYWVLGNNVDKVDKD